MTLSIINSAYLYEKPYVINLQAYRQAVIGDLHANAMKFFYFLVAEGIFDISNDDYETLAEIYQKKPSELSEADIKNFNRIIDEGLTLKNPTLIRLIGDEVGDRGQNDYFILKILEKLRKNNLDVEIMMSNHGVELVHALEKLEDRDGVLKRTTLGNCHARSLDNMEMLRKRGLISQEEIIELVDEAYKPCLKALSYSLHPSKDEITLYSHAAIDIKLINYLATKLKVDYNDATAKELAQTIDAINEKIQTHVQNGTLNKLYSEEQLLSGYHQCSIDASKYPLEFMMWNRRYEKDIGAPINRLPMYKGYKVNYVHGHDSHDLYDGKAHILNLDNDLGKSVSKLAAEGKYSVLRTNDVNLAFKPTNKDEIHEQEEEGFKHKQYPEGEGMLDWPSMCIIAGFVAAIGIAAVALAITVLSMGIVPAMAMGAVCAGVALVSSFTMLGFFKGGGAAPAPAPQTAAPSMGIELTNAV